ncbi:hypothetical protein FHG87_006756 [Trinorchestia longiramus]|nr:hypothetical protein FHG87_006756 [Trinorchestia longiramus]
MIPELRNLTYERRLQRLELISVEQRRLRGQLIETFKYLNGLNNVTLEGLFERDEINESLSFQQPSVKSKLSPTKCVNSKLPASPTTRRCSLCVVPHSLSSRSVGDEHHQKERKRGVCSKIFKRNFTTSESLSQKLIRAFVHTSVSQSGPHRPSGGVEEMQGGGRRVRLEWGAYIAV